MSGMKPASFGRKKIDSKDTSMNSVRWFTQAYQTTPWRKQLSIGMFILAGVFIVILAGSLYLDVTARAAAYGRAILIMESQIIETETLNAHLRSQLGVITSSATMEKRALELGFRRVDPEETMYLTVPGYVPLDQRVITPPNRKITATTVTLSKVYTESLVDWLRKKLQNLTLPAMESSP